MIRRTFTLIGLLIAAAASLATAAPSPQSASAQEELRDLKSRISAIQKRLGAAEDSRSEITDALRASERAISDANRALAQLGEASRRANERVLELRRERERAEQALGAQREALANLLYQQYTAGRPETLGILLNRRDPNTIARELHYLTYIGRARSQLIARARENNLRLARLARDAESKAAELATITSEQAEQRRKLEREKNARAQVLARLSKDIANQRRRMSTLKRDETRLTRLVEQLAKLAAQRARARAAQESRTRRGPARGNGTPPAPAPPSRAVPGPSARDGGAFASLRGRLSLPVRGELANRFGSPRQDGGLVWKGLFIAAPGGEAVRAIAAGRVVFADWLRGFGNLLIIDHGDSYMSLYGYNEALFKQVGDALEGGERIAAVGNSGGHADSGLYFEMRHEGRPFDPLGWVMRK